MESLMLWESRKFFSRHGNQPQTSVSASHFKTEKKRTEITKMVYTLPLRNVTVVFQGVEGAYSYAAMRAYFPEEIKSYHAETFRNAMEEVVSGRADYASSSD